MLAKKAWQKYWVEAVSLKETASFLGMSVNTLTKRFDEWGFPTRRPGPRSMRRGLSAEAVSQLLARLDNASQSEVAREFKVSRQYVHQLVRRYRG